MVYQSPTLTNLFPFLSSHRGKMLKWLSAMRQLHDMTVWLRITYQKLGKARLVCLFAKKKKKKPWQKTHAVDSGGYRWLQNMPENVMYCMWSDGEVLSTLLKWTSKVVLWDILIWSDIWPGTFRMQWLNSSFNHEPRVVTLDDSIIKRFDYRWKQESKARGPPPLHKK